MAYTDTMNELDSIIKEIDHLKPVSTVVGKVMELVDDPDSGMSDLSEIIRHEPALTANLLKLANSAYFGLPGKIDDVHQAIVYLGMTQVVDLVLIVSCSSGFQGTQDGYGLHAGDLWRSAVGAALIAKDLAIKKGLKQHAIPLTGALLRDVGKVVLNQFMKSDIYSIFKLVKEQEISFIAAERQVIGYDHTEVGAMIAKAWHFPDAIQTVIRCHHAPLEAKGFTIEASIVCLADTCSRKMGFGLGWDDSFYPDEDDVAQSLELSDELIAGVMDHFERKMERVNALMEIR